MAQLGFNVNVNDLPEDDGGNFDPIPSGMYDARIADAEVRTTKAGTGNYIALRLDIVGPSHEGRVVFGNVTLKNPNEKAEEIGRQQLGKIMRACGIPDLSDTDQLIGSVVGIKVSIRKSEEYGDQNEVKDYKTASAGAPAQPMGSAPAAQAASAPPWARK